MPAPSPAKLNRTISGFGGLLLTLTVLSPSIGVFIVGSDSFHQVGSGAILCFAAAALLGIAMAAIYAELGSAFPHAGGEYTIAGRVLGPASGFAMLSVTILACCINTALSGLGVSDYMAALIPNLPPISTALILVIAVTLISLFSVRFNAWVTGLFLAAELASLAALSALGLAHANPHNAAAILHPVLPDAAGHLHPVPLALMGVGAAAGLYAFNGYGGVVYFSEEIRRARHNVAGVIYAALAIATLAEMTPMLAILLGTPDIARLAQSPNPLPDFILQRGGALWSKALSLGVALAIFNAMIATTLAGSRILYASARDQSWPRPISQALARIHPRFHSPYIATLLFGTLCLLLCLVPPPILVTISGNGNVAMYGCLALATLVGRRTGSTTASKARMPLYPLAPALILLALIGIILADLQDPATGQIGLLTTLLTLALGAAYFTLALKRTPHFAFRPPLDEDA